LDIEVSCAKSEQRLISMQVILIQDSALCLNQNGLEKVGFGQDGIGLQ
jgi:hypothetical protein